MLQRIFDLFKAHPVAAIVAGLALIAVLLALTAGGLNRRAAAPRRRRF